MKTHAIDPDDDMDGLEIDPTTMFEVLSNERRQYALRYLSHKPAAVPLGDVAEYIAIREGEPTQDRYERVLTGLYHLHLPHLIEAGIVAYNPDQQTVALRLDDDVIRPYFDLLTASS